MNAATRSLPDHWRAGLLVVERYRAATISLDCFGDSVLDSPPDALFAVLGFVLAARLPIWATAAIDLFFEAFTGWTIRDNLTLDVPMLLSPPDAVRRRQSGT